MSKVLKRVLVGALSVVTVMGTFVGCDNSSNSNSSKVKEPKDVVVSYDSPEEISKSFVESLLNKKYGTALSCLLLPEGKSFLTGEDIEYHLPKSKYSDICDLSYEDYTIKVEEGNKTNILTYCNVTVTDNSSEKSTDTIFAVGTYLADDKRWAVNAVDFYISNYSFVTEKDAKVSVNGISVSDDLCTKESKDTKEYTLPFVGMKGIEVSISSDDYTYSKTLTTKANNKIGKEDRVFHEE